MIHTFNKEDGTWYIDLPEFLELGLGTKGNLMMVAGADTFLDILSSNSDTVVLEFDSKPFEGFTDTLVNTGMGKDQDVLDDVGHPEVPYGGYYRAIEKNHDLWLCPVTEWVFKNGYPKNIYVKVVS